MITRMSCEKLAIWEYVAVAPFVVAFGLDPVVEPGLALGLAVGLALVTESGNVV